MEVQVLSTALCGPRPTGRVIGLKIRPVWVRVPGSACAAVVQLVEASGSDPEGWWFESTSRHRECSSAGRAVPLQGKGREFDSPHFHTGNSPVGRAPDLGSGGRRFEPCFPDVAVVQLVERRTVTALVVDSTSTGHPIGSVAQWWCGALLMRGFLVRLQAGPYVWFTTEYLVVGA